MPHGFIFNQKEFEKLTTRFENGELDLILIVKDMECKKNAFAKGFDKWL